MDYLSFFRGWFRTIFLVAYISCDLTPLLTRKTIFIEYPIFRQIATSWSEIHLLCQKEVA